jgi:DNA-binding transcriptional LysR family regulator
MDRLDAMALFAATAAAGSFSAASRRLGVPLPTLSRKVAALEAHLNTRLFARSTRRLALTGAGETYLAACKQILEQVGEAEALAAGEFQSPRGELVITAPIVFGRLHLLPVVNAFLVANPQIVVRLLLVDRNLPLVDEHIDVALRIGPLQDSRLVAVRVGSVRRVVCASPPYLARRGRPRTPSDLARHDIVSFESLPASQAWHFAPRTGRRAQTVAVRPRLTVNTAEAAVDAAIAGLGLTHVLSYQAAGALAAGQLARVLGAYEPEPVPVNLLYTDPRRLPLKTRSFVDFAVPRLRKALA